jgi:RNA polymerase sigma-70 factor (ECF subfamily)
VAGARSDTMGSAPASASASAHEPTEFERRLRETQRVVYQIAYGVLGSEADAEDVSQDVFLRAYRKLGGLRDPEKFRAWVARMSRRLALNHQRAAGRAQRRESSWLETTAVPAASAETEVAARDFNARLRDEIGSLPEKLRSVLLLSAVEGLDTRGAADVLGIPQGTVRSRLHSARKRLLQRFSP